MLRGTCNFVCKDCGNKFIEMDRERYTTVYTNPVKCPKCGSMNTCSSGITYYSHWGNCFV